MKGGEAKAQAKSTDERYEGIWDGVCLFDNDLGWLELDMLWHRLKTRGKKAGKKVKDPNKPKRPPSAFFVFLEGFRKEFNLANPDNKSVGAVSSSSSSAFIWRLLVPYDSYLIIY